ncbi:lycopene cyclase [Streptomyces sp. CB00455]|uniref:lycopene cyclase family protein n=1 Tax=Streptomyces sp. CB00455 TaxID=1703927 RepID=UPI00094033E9|nr:lycopene cyclase family protein [Streptomyces sp. CB00455]OKK21934.1 lycopene cyclase [Streptomyces sp. CB00455]
MSWDADVTVVGAGAAGLSLADRLTDPDGPAPAPRVVVVEAPAGPHRAPDRTWCYWEAGDGPFDDMLTASWARLRVYGSEGHLVDRTTGPLRYKMLRSQRFTTVMRQRLRARGVEVRRMTVDSALDTAGGAEVRGRDAAGQQSVIRSRWVCDSRPPPYLPAARTTLLQHFRGWFVTTLRPAFDPAVPVLMDFRTPQPARGLSFGYVLPLSPHEALVEYTEFSPSVLSANAYESAVRHYCDEVLRLGELRVLSREQGVIPMTDGRFPRRSGRRVLLIGGAGGATRPSTGYTFAAIQRQTEALAGALRTGLPPDGVPAVHGRRARAMDAVLLRALDTGRVEGGSFFTRLFSSVPTERMLRFLDGATTPWEDIGIGMRTPVLPMLLSLVELPLLPRTVPAAVPGRH